MWAIDTPTLLEKCLAMKLGTFDMYKCTRMQYITHVHAALEYFQYRPSAQP